MKSYLLILIAFLFGAFVVSAGWGGAIYSAMLVVGFLTLVVFCTLVWTFLEKKKVEAKDRSNGTDERKDAG